ncbi:MAG: 3-isopropylmalate dehydrogenase [Chloroflexi bacterium]|nr:3-isopropylmalate dehydrogenase [Chloroflexota bacterium]
MVASTRKYRIGLLKGDGVGPEVVQQGVKVLCAAARRYSFEVELTEGAIGLSALAAYGSTCPRETIDLCQGCDAVLMGAHGGLAEEQAYRPIDPMGAVRGLRKALGLYANLRPAKLLAPLAPCSSLKPAALSSGVDFVIMRELTSGLAYGRPRGLRSTAQGRYAVNTLRYREKEVRRLLHVAFQLAGTRNKKLAVVAQDNALETSQLWRQVAMEMAPSYPSIELAHYHPDNFGRLLIQSPGIFDIIVVDNMFIGGIYNDQAGAIVGSLGMLPSAELKPSEKKDLVRCRGLYEPVHGSVPHRTGKDQVNPLGTIMSCVMLLRFSLGEIEAARAVEAAVDRVTLKYRTYDIMTPEAILVGTSQMGDLVAQAVSKGKGR